MKDEVRYSRESPPPNPDAAKARLDQVIEVISRIELRLKNKDPKEFTEPSEYTEWQGRARGALSHHRKEESFLQHYLSGTVPPKDNSLSSLNGKKHAEVLNQFEVEVKEILDALNYEATVTASHLPKNIDIARKRFDMLTQGRNDLISVSTSLRSRAQKSGLGQKTVSRLLYPIVEIQNSVNGELSILAWYIKFALHAKQPPAVANLPDKFRDVRNYDISSEIVELRKKIGVRTTFETIEVLYGLVITYAANCPFTPSDKEKLEAVGRIIQLSKSQRDLEGREK